MAIPQLDFIQAEQATWSHRNFGLKEIEKQRAFAQHICHALGVAGAVNSATFADVIKILGEYHPLDDPMIPTLGVAEEAGELCHAILKARQGIRRNEDHEAMAKDAVGDISIYLMDLCNKKGWLLSDIIQETWDGVVVKRDWHQNPDTGS